MPKLTFHFALLDKVDDIDSLAKPFCLNSNSKSTTFEAKRFCHLVNVAFSHIGVK
jgi:hypothetical protein